jgi:hypothetical protein
MQRAIWGDERELSNINAGQGLYCLTREDSVVWCDVKGRGAVSCVGGSAGDHRWS